MLKVCVKLAALSAEWPGRRKTYGPGETQTHDHAFRGIFSTTELPVHIGQVGSVATW